jgi:O-antigen/teichoic acid export membrane protein
LGALDAVQRRPFGPWRLTLKAAAPPATGTELLTVAPNSASLAVEPALSIVVVTRGPSLMLARLIRSIGRAHGCTSAELILGVDGAGPAELGHVEDLARRFFPGEVLVAPLPKDHPGQNRNALVQFVRAPAVVFLDDDVSIPEGFLDAAGEALSDPAVGVAGGPNLTPPGSSEFERLSGDVLAAAIATGPVRHRYRTWRPGPASERSLTLCNLVIRRSLLDPPPPFDPHLKCAEENELLLRLTRDGVKMVYEPELAVYHQRRGTLSSYGRQMAKYGFGRGQLLARAFYAKQTTYALPLLAFCILAAGLAFAPPIGLAALAAYAITLLAAGFAIGGARKGPLAALLIGATHVGYTSGMVAGLGYEAHRLQRRVMQASQGRFGRDAALTLVALGLAIGGGIASGIVVARALGPHGRGTFALVQTITGIIALVAGFGFGRAAVFLRPRDEVTDSELFGVVCASLLPGSLVAALVGLIVTRTGVLTLGQLNVWLMCGSIPLITFFYNAQAALQGIKQQAWFRRTLGLRDALFFVFVVAAISIHATMRVVLIAWMAHWFVSSITIAVLLYRHCGRPRLPFGRTRRLASVGASQLLLSLIIQAHLRLDVVLLDVLRGPTALGHYAVAVGAAEPITYGGVAVALALYPRTATSAAVNLSAGGVRTARSLRVVVTLTAVAAAALWVVGPRLLPLMFGSRFDAAGAPLRALLPGIVGMTMFFVLMSDLAGRGKIRTIGIVSLVSTVANVLINLVLIPRYGPTGAALSSTITYWGMALWVLAIFARCTGIPMLRCVIPRPRDARAIAAAFFGRRSDALV